MNVVRLSFKTTISSLLIAFLAMTSTAAFTCTRVLYAPKGEAVLVGDNMDWFEDMKTNLYVYPRGIDRQGSLDRNPMHWTSKYGSIVATAYDQLSTNGMNERGLAAHLLFLSGSDYGIRDESYPGILVVLWAQFYLDNFQTVDEAIKFTETTPFQLVTFIEPNSKRRADLHLAIEDATGDSAIIEYTNGKPHIYHSRDYTVMTNDPTYDVQWANLKQYQGFGGDKPLPGTTQPTDRFVRAQFYSSHLPASDSVQDEVLKLLTVMQNAGQPYGEASPERPRVSMSIWRVIADLTHRVYYFNSLSRFNIVWAQLDKLNLNVGAPVLKLDVVNKKDLAGDVTNEFVSCKM